MNGHVASAAPSAPTVEVAINRKSRLEPPPWDFAALSTVSDMG
jgi:hypothetical protein